MSNCIQGVTLKKHCYIVPVIFLALVISLSCKTNAENKIQMPKGFENVYLGMSVKELKKIKPHISPDSVPFPNLYFEENTGNSYFPGGYPGEVSYEFSSGDLVRIILSYGSKDQDYIRSRIPGLIKGAIDLWGNDYERKVGYKINPDKPSDVHLFPLYYWKKSGIDIVIQPTEVDFPDKPNIPYLYYEIYIFKPDYAPKYIKTKLDATSRTKEFEEVFSVIPDISNYNGPVFE